MRILLSLAALFAIVGCGGSSYGGGGGGGGVTDPQPVATTSVSLRNLAFSPGAIRVAAGATVTFTNNDGIAHNITFTSQTITGATNFSTGARSVVMPATPGTYAYHCTIHPGMTGSVLVQ